MKKDYGWLQNGCCIHFIAQGIDTKELKTVNIQVAFMMSLLVLTFLIYISLHRVKNAGIFNIAMSPAG